MIDVTKPSSLAADDWLYFIALNLVDPYIQIPHQTLSVERGCKGVGPAIVHLFVLSVTELRPCRGTAFNGFSRTNQHQDVRLLIF